MKCDDTKQVMNAERKRKEKKKRNKETKKE